MAASKPRLVLRRDLVFLDYVFLFLGLMSLIIWGLDFSRSLEPDEVVVLRWTDYATIAVFGVVFLGKLLAADFPLRYLKAHWFAIFGFFPLTNPLFIPPRFYIVVQILIVVSRFGQAIDRAFGAHVLKQVFARYRAAVVEELTDPLLDRLLFVIQINLVRGRYAASIGEGIDRRRAEVRMSVEKAIMASPKLTTITKIPGAEEAIHNAVQEGIDAAVAALKSDELNRAIQETLNEAFEDLRKSVRERSWKEQGVGLGDVATGLMKGSA